MTPTKDALLRTIRTVLFLTEGVERDVPTDIFNAFNEPDVDDDAAVLIAGAFLAGYAANPGAPQPAPNRHERRRRGR